MTWAQHYIREHYGTVPHDRDGWYDRGGSVSGMSAAEAGAFREDDEDPAAIFAAFDAGSHGVTAPPAGSAAAAQIRWGLDYIRRVCGRGMTA